MDNGRTTVGIRVARIVNLISMVLLFLVGILFAMIAVPNFSKARLAAGGSDSLALNVAIGIAFALPGFVPALFLGWINKGLRAGKPTARAWQIVLSCLCLLGFPVGTLLHGVVLYFMLADPQTKAVFTNG